MHLWGVGVFYVGIFFLLLPYNNFKYMLDRSRYHHQQPHCVGPLLPSRGGRRKNRTQEEDGGAAGLRAVQCSGQRGSPSHTFYLRFVLRCVALHCAAFFVLRCVLFRCVVLRCAALCCAALCSLSLCCTALCCVVFSFVVLYCVVLPCVVLRCVVFSFVALCCTALHLTHDRCWQDIDYLLLSYSHFYTFH